MTTPVPVLLDEALEDAEARTLGTDNQRGTERRDRDAVGGERVLHEGCERGPFCRSPALGFRQEGIIKVEGGSHT